MTTELNKHRLEFIDQGFTIFKSIFDTETIQEWQNIASENQAKNPNKKLYGHFLETNSEISFKTVSNANILNFLETIWGPFIQLDSLTLVVSPPILNKSIDREKGISWHRDPYSYLPKSNIYDKPLGINMLVYLQDLTDTIGPLRVIPRTHKQPITIPNNERFIPNVREKLIYLGKGDVIVLHTNLIHSRSPNISESLRSYLSVFYTLSILKSTINTSSENIKRIIDRAIYFNDKRILRLYGIDDDLQDRTNCGGMENEETFWAEWIEEDKRSLNY